MKQMSCSLNIQTKKIITKNFLKDLLISELLKKFPHLFENGQIKKELFLKQLNEELSQQKEQQIKFFWKGKEKVLDDIKKIEEISFFEENLDVFGNCVYDKDFKNLFFVSENLKCLLFLLKNGFLGKIKHIYIDPPYNTLRTQSYNDNFRTDISEDDVVINVDDSVDVDLSSVLSSNSVHSNWINLIYPRLLLARMLMSDDGLMYVSLDSFEITNLIEIVKEIFGEKSILKLLIVRRAISGVFNSKFASRIHEYILVVSKNRNFIDNKKLEYLNREEFKILNDFNYTNNKSSFEIYDDLGDELAFLFPKSVSLVKKTIEITENLVGLKDGDIVLDFFAGSGTTARSVLEYSLEKNIILNFILCQQKELNSYTKSERFKYITNVTEERLKSSMKRCFEQYSKNKLESELKLWLDDDEILKNFEFGYKKIEVV